MPIYQLVCAACNKEFEVLASISDREGKKIICPDCGGKELKPVYTGKANVCLSGKKGDSPLCRCSCGCCKA